MLRPRSSWLPALIFVLFAALVPGEIASQPPRLKHSPNVAVTDAGSWRVILKGTELRKVSLERSQPYHLIDLRIVRFDTRWVVPRIVRSTEYNLKAANVKTLAEKSGAIAMINANFFDQRARPLGFLKPSDDQSTPRISQSALFNGIFGVKNRLPFIVHRDRFSPQQADEGLQAGPLLIARGTALEITRGASRQSRRSVIGIDGEKRIVIAVADSILGGLTWVELQELFGSGEWQVNTVDLLNLDGGGSAQLYVKGLQVEEHVPGATEVPVALGFFQRAP